MPGQNSASEAEAPTATKEVNNDTVLPAEDDAFKPAKEGK